jgi:hypothetical protein
LQIDLVRLDRTVPVAGCVGSLGLVVPSDDLDAESFAFELLFRGIDENSFPRKIGADAWFAFRNADRYQEQSFRLPNDEVLHPLFINAEPGSILVGRQRELAVHGRTRPK